MGRDEDLGAHGDEPAGEERPQRGGVARAPPGPSTTRPAGWRPGRPGSSRRPSPRPPEAGSSSSTDSSRRSTRPRAEDHQPDVVAVDLDVAAVVRWPAAPEGGGRGRGAARVARQSRRSVTSTTSSDPISRVRPGDGAQYVGLGGAAVAVGAQRRQLGRVDVSQHVGMAGERDDRPCAGPSGDSTSTPPSAGGNDAPPPARGCRATDARSWPGYLAPSLPSALLGAIADRGRRNRRPDRAGRLSSLRSLSRGRGRGTGWRTCGPGPAARGCRRTRPTGGTRPFSVAARCPCSLPQCGRPS